MDGFVIDAAGGGVKYTVEMILGCKVVSGTLPLRDSAQIMQSMGKDAELDIAMAHRIGAKLVMGAPKDLAALRAAGLPPGHQVSQDLARAKTAGLSEAACDWLDGYDRGNSSDALFSVCTGVTVGSGTKSLPRDLADLGRCVRAAASVPEIGANLARAKSMGPDWASLVDEWENLGQLVAAKDWNAVSQRLRRGEASA
jgi:hypothetical protein